MYKQICLFIFGLKQQRFFEKRFANDMDKFSRIYMFHKVSKGETNLSEYNSNYLDFEKFILNEMKKFKPVNIYDVCFTKKKSFSITFDDGYKCVYDYAIPILEKYSIPYTLFITTDFLGKKGYLSKNLLKTISKSKLCTIGSHTLSHPLLRFDSNYKKEIRDSKEVFEKIIEKKVDIFAYPYGSMYACSKKNIRFVKKSKYLYAFSTVGCVLNKVTKRNKFYISRLNGDVFVKK